VSIDVAAPPALGFGVADAGPANSTAAPALSFPLEIEASAPVRSLMLDVQVRIAVRRRTYDAPTRERLREVLGDMHAGGGAPGSYKKKPTHPVSYKKKRTQHTPA
jgi:hypothetical protein